MGLVGSYGIVLFCMVSSFTAPAATFPTFCPNKSSSIFKSRWSNSHYQRISTAVSDGTYMNRMFRTAVLPSPGILLLRWVESCSAHSDINELHEKEDNRAVLRSKSMRAEA